MTESKSRSALIKDIQMSTFALVETNLFLDSHPSDTDALSALKRYNRERSEAIAEYEKRFGALFIGSATCVPYSYVTQPFPWETEV